MENIWKLSKKATEYLNRVNWKAVKGQFSKDHGEGRRLNMLEDIYGEMVDYSDLRDMVDTNEDQEEELFQLGSRDSVEKPVCHKLLLGNKCDGGTSCKYDHSPARLNSEKERLVVHWRREKEGQRQLQPLHNQQAQTQMFKRDQPGFKTPQSKSGDVRIIDREAIVQEREDQSMIALVSGLFQTGASPDVWRATHRDAQASVDGVHFFDIGVGTF